VGGWRVTERRADLADIPIADFVSLRDAKEWVNWKQGLPKLNPYANLNAPDCPLTVDQKSRLPVWSRHFKTSGRVRARSVDPPESDIARYSQHVSKVPCSEVTAGIKEIAASVFISYQRTRAMQVRRWYAANCDGQHVFPQTIRARVRNRLSFSGRNSSIRQRS
jgi:hypothetical protein